MNFYLKINLLVKNFLAVRFNKFSLFIIDCKSSTKFIGILTGGGEGCV